MARKIRAGNTKTELRDTFVRCLVAYILYLDPDISIEEITELFISFYEANDNGRHK